MFFSLRTFIFKLFHFKDRDLILWEDLSQGDLVFVNTKLQIFPDYSEETQDCGNHLITSKNHLITAKLKKERDQIQYALSCKALSSGWQDGSLVHLAGGCSSLDRHLMKVMHLYLNCCLIVKLMDSVEVCEVLAGCWLTS